ncbi:MAG: type II toxin-antitoxin system RelE/ParE family toxin [candidate division NC10 bacterium]|nr:type II toxin-antitoxin system RelE/ParE family toxin [candidate division NC10 bacterium]MBI4841163.1 type II toxin-antitoxin system RelE/ParE family toxin [candidate division NC10 bacterium]
MSDKPIFWLGSARSDLRAFPPDARRVAGFQLRRLQQGLEPNDWKPIPSVGPGVQEIRIHTGLAHRIFYLAKFAEGVYVLHAFEKRTRKTSTRDLELARDRFRALLMRRRREDVTRG